MNVPRASCQKGLCSFSTVFHATAFRTVESRSVHKIVKERCLNLWKPLILVDSHAGMSFHIDMQLPLHGYQTLIDRKFELY